MNWKFWRKAEPVVPVRQKVPMSHPAWDVDMSRSERERWCVYMKEFGPRQATEEIMMDRVYGPKELSK